MPLLVPLTARLLNPVVILNVDQLAMNFDHSASSGIIGTATNDVHGTDHDAVNWDKYYEFLNEMCNCNSRSIWTAGFWGMSLGPFTPEDVSIFIAQMNKFLVNSKLLLAEIL